MTIVATCRCGASFAANPQIAGTTVACPQCGQPLMVPHVAAQPSYPAMPTAQTSPPPVSPAAPRPAAPRPAAPRPPAPRPAAPRPSAAPPQSAPVASSGSVLKLLLIIGGSVGGFLIICVVLVFALGKSEKAEEDLEFGTGNSTAKSVVGAGDKKPEQSLADKVFGKASNEIAK